MSVLSVRRKANASDSDLGAGEDNDAAIRPRCEELEGSEVHEHQHMEENPYKRENADNPSKRRRSAQDLPGRHFIQHRVDAREFDGQQESHQWQDGVLPVSVRHTRGHLYSSGSSLSSTHGSSSSNLSAAGSCGGGEQPQQPQQQRLHSHHHHHQEWEAFPSSRPHGGSVSHSHHHHPYHHRGSASLTDSVSSMASAYSSAASFGAEAPHDSRDADLSNDAGGQVSYSLPFSPCASSSASSSALSTSSSTGGGSATHRGSNEWGNEMLYLQVNSASGVRYYRGDDLGGASQMPPMAENMRGLPAVDVSTNELLDTLTLLDSDGFQGNNHHQDQQQRRQLAPPKSPHQQDWHHHEAKLLEGVHELPVFPDVGAYAAALYPYTRSAQPLSEPKRAGLSSQTIHGAPISRFNQHEHWNRQRQCPSSDDWSPAALNAMLRDNPFNSAPRQQEEQEAPLTASIFGKKRVVGSSTFSVSTSALSPPLSSSDWVVPGSKSFTYQQQSSPVQGPRPPPHPPIGSVEGMEQKFSVEQEANAQNVTRDVGERRSPSFQAAATSAAAPADAIKCISGPELQKSTRDDEENEEAESSLTARRQLSCGMSSTRGTSASGAAPSTAHLFAFNIFGKKHSQMPLEPGVRER